ncbi:cytochrome P450 [Xylariaceae sp. FL1019]|nr:cytochrome P450 [Xylariaceae sp. FL1019]
MGFVLLCILLALFYLSYAWLSRSLRDYPGPFLAKFTNAYSAAYAINGTLHTRIFKTHQDHGSMVQIGPNRLVFNSATALQDIYHNEKVSKAPIYLATQARSGAFSIWNVLDRDLHRRKRKMVGRATSDASMKLFESSMQEQIDIFIGHLRETEGQPVDMKTRCSYLSFDIIGLLSFGYALRLQTDKTNQFLPELLSRTNHRMNVYIQFPVIPRCKLQKFLNLPFRQEREKTARLIETMVRSRMSQDKDAKRDLYFHVADAVQAKDDETLRVGDLWLEAFFFIIAGGDTVATTLCATLFYLTRNRKCYSKLAHEIRNAVQDDSEITGATAGGLSYLRACIDEAMRMSPPVPGTLWRHVAQEDMNEGSLVVDGQTIPPGTQVGVNIYSLHHNTRYFPDPFTYNPDRWMSPSLSEDEEIRRKSMQDAFAPFSIGSRGCAGKPMAYMELTLTLAKLFWHFDFEAAPGKLGTIGAGKHGEFQLRDVFTAAYDGPFIVFKARNTSL